MIWLNLFWFNMDINCPNPNKFDLSYVDWLERIWKYKSWYDKVFHNPLEQIITIAWAMWS